MSDALTIISWVVSPLAAVVITLIFKEPLQERLVPLLTIFGTKKAPSITGIWRATFYFGNSREAYIEHIELRNAFGVLEGKIVPHPDNYEEIKKTENKNPLRVRGLLKDNLFFSGTWYHPIETSHHTGTFDLLISRSNDRMSGRWLGYSQRRNAIESDRWEWERIEIDAKQSG